MTKTLCDIPALRAAPLALCSVVTLALASLGGASVGAAEPTGNVQPPAEGRVHWRAEAVAGATAGAASGPLKLAGPAPAGGVLRIWCADDLAERPLGFTATQGAWPELTLPAAAPGAMRLELATAAKSTQFADGLIALLPGDAQRSRGPVEAVLTWDYKATRWGAYTAELTYALASGQAMLELRVGEAKAMGKLEATGDGRRFVTTSLGPIALPAGPVKVQASLIVAADGSTPELRAVLLRPASEGAPVTQGADGVAVCHARDATVRGVSLRWEPKPEKQTLGYWTQVNDRAHWDVTMTRAGRYRVEVLQGCGKGHGGSKAAVTVGGKALEFVVEDTGHFQNFVPRDLGEVEVAGPGLVRVEVLARSKAKAAVMDVRQVRLLPALPAAPAPGAPSAPGGVPGVQRTR